MAYGYCMRHEAEAYHGPSRIFPCDALIKGGMSNCRDEEGRDCGYWNPSLPTLHADCASLLAVTRSLMNCASQPPTSFDTALQPEREALTSRHDRLVRPASRTTASSSRNMRVLRWQELRGYRGRAEVFDRAMHRRRSSMGGRLALRGRLRVELRRCGETSGKSHAGTSSGAPGSGMILPLHMMRCCCRITDRNGSADSGCHITARRVGRDLWELAILDVRTALEREALLRAAW